MLRGSRPIPLIRTKSTAGNLIPVFFQYVLQDSVRSNDLFTAFQKLEDQLRQNLVRAIDTTGHTARDLFGVSPSRQVMQIRSLVELWAEHSKKYTQLRKLLKRYDNLVTQINHEIASYIQSEDQHG